jgi:hypothetical protein
MKLLLILFLTSISFSAFCQSYLIMENGMIITTDKNGFVYDLGHYAYPHKVTMRGGLYFVEEGNILATVDENGLLFRKYEDIPQKILGRGTNYFLSENGELFTINHQGQLRTFHSTVFKNAENFGGNYFTISKFDETQTSKIIDLMVVNSSGDILKVEIPELATQYIVFFGGSYFMTNKGIVFTVSEDGRVLEQKNHRVGLIQKKGGNFFVDSSGYFYTVSEKGQLLVPELPYSMKTSTILRLGSQYFIDQSGKFFVITREGRVLERTLQDQDFKTAHIISL